MRAEEADELACHEAACSAAFLPAPDGCFQVLAAADAPVVEPATDSPADGHVLGAQSDVPVRNDPDEASSAVGFSGGDDGALDDIDDPSDPDDASVEWACASAAPTAALEGAAAGAGTPGPRCDLHRYRRVGPDRPPKVRLPFF